MIFSSLLSTKFGLAVAASMIPVGGVSAAVFTGALPLPATVSQSDVARSPHVDLTGTASESDGPTESESPEPSETPTAAPVGPDATGPAAFGLCNAWSHGGLSPNSVPFGNLSKAAGGRDGIESYCAGIVRHGKPGEELSGTESSEPLEEAHEHGRQSDVPRGTSEARQGKSSHGS